MKKILGNYLNNYLVYIKLLFHQNIFKNPKISKKEFSPDELDKIRYIMLEKLTDNQLKKLVTKLKIYFMGPLNLPRDQYEMIIDECERKDFYSNYWQIIKNKYRSFFNSNKKLYRSLQKLSKIIKKNGGLGEKNTRLIFKKILRDYFSNKIDSKILEAVSCHLFFELNQPVEIFDYWDKNLAETIFSACNIYSYKKYTDLRYKKLPLELKRLIKKEQEKIFNNIHNIQF